MRKKSHLKKTVKSSSNYWTRLRKRYFGKLFFAFFIGTVVYGIGTYVFKPIITCANSLSCNSDLSLRIENGAIGVFEGHTVYPPEIDLLADKTKPSVLGTDIPSGEKHIYVDLSSQTLYAYQGDTKIMQTFIASGRWNKTPVGNFHIWEKLRSTRMSGGSGEDAYDLPNVPYVMYFYHDFGLHGAYWHDNFGHTMSHGCVNMRQIDAQMLYDWVDGPTDNQKGTAVSTCSQFIPPDTCIQDQPLNS